MPKTIAITPSWYWPANVARVTGVPPFHLDEQLVERWARHRPDDVAVVAGDERVTGEELLEKVSTAAGALRQRVGQEQRVVLAAGPSLEGTILFLAAARAGVPLLLVDPDDPGAAGGKGAALACADERGAAGLAGSGLEVARLAELSAEPVRTSGTELTSGSIGFVSGDDVVWHSHRSLLGGAISLQTFLQVGSERPWLSTHSVSSWEGVYGAMVPLVAGGTLVLSEPGEAAIDAVAREGVGRMFTDLDSAFATTRDAKRQLKAIRGVLEFVLLSTSGLFDPDERRRVSKMFDCPALTLFGMPEVGPIFASHASWYLDESIGIPLSNAHVVPVDPRSQKPIPTLWEMVESAMVTIWSPSLFVGYEAGDRNERLVDGRLVTGVVASSDANGMIYLLPD